MEILHSKKITKPGPSLATQQFLDVIEVKENVVVLKNGSFRSILAISAINYELKSTDEQNAIINKYQEFLNSLDFPVQIIISSKKLNIEAYVQFLNEKQKIQPNELLKMQISEYTNFIQHLVSVSNIMDKSFYIVVPFSPIESTERSFFSNLITRFNPQRAILEKRELFETYRSQLFQRVEHVILNLTGIGLTVIPLKTQEIIELLYHSYNPDIFNLTNLVDINNLELR